MKVRSSFQPAWRCAALVLAFLGAGPIAARADAKLPPAALHVQAPHPDGKPARARLARDTAFAGFVCRRDTEIGFHPNGKVSFCTIAKATVLDGLPIAAGAYTLFYESGRVWQTYLREPRRFTAGLREVPCAAALVSLHPSGALSYCELAAQLVVGTIECRAGQGISLHPDGALAGATIERPVLAPQLRYGFGPGTALQWSPSGVIIGGRLLAPTVIGGLPLRGEFQAHERGGLAKLELSAAVRVQGHDFPEGAELTLSPDGHLAAAEYVEERGFLPHGEMWTDTRHMTFAPDGTVTSSTVTRWQAEARPPKFR